ncbi:aminoacyl-tRNA hydrolase [Candidatus Parcubacteria bacterium]|nr:MAG: aminoacyl-tRNA hydrolase [Candidatus Parcubacteria bacterium]
MYLFIGLGNPGPDCAGTRHNIGRETLLAAVRKLGFPAPAPSAKLQALVAEGKIGKEKAAFVLPETFMNKSGNAAGPAAKFYKVKPKQIVVLHDDADLMLGATKLSFNKSSNGHKGVDAIARALKTREFWRMRIGIQKKRRVPAEKLVLEKFRGNEEATAKTMVKKSIAAIEAITDMGPERAMNQYNA